MRRLTLLALCGLPLLAFSPACRGSGDDGNNTDGGNNGSDGSHGSDGSGSGGTLTTIQQVQDDSNASGSMVELTGVVVTAIDAYGATTGDFWVEDPAGGMYSGVHVFHGDLSVVATLQPGDVVNISGAIKDEFALSSDTSGNTETEIEPASGGTMTITKTGSGTVPAPLVVDALSIGQMTDPTARYAAWEPSEGVLITIQNVAAEGAPKCVGSACNDTTNQYFTVTGGIEPESSLAAFPTGIVLGSCFSSITGIQSYFFNTLLYNRTTADFGATGTSCPLENTVALCEDGIDNDGNGFTDCDDFACQAIDPTCVMTTTITAIQATTPPGAIEIDNVYVTGIAHNGRAFWISTNPAAAVNEGVYVYNSQTLPAGVVQGSKLTKLVGTVQEYNDDTMGGTLTEVIPSSLTFDNTSPATIVPITGQTAATLLAAATAPMYESVLVTLTNVNITAIGVNTNGYVATAVQNGTTFGVGTDIIQLTAAQEGCYASITGFWTNLEAGATAATTKPNAFGFIPLTLGATGTMCN